jgi:hypothetical protein
MSGIEYRFPDHPAGSLDAPSSNLLPFCSWMCHFKAKSQIHCLREYDDGENIWTKVIRKWVWMHNEEFRNS